MYGLKRPAPVFKVGERVQLHPATDAWMMGDRYGEVIKVGTRRIHIKMDRSEKVRKVFPRDILDPLGGL